MTSLSSNDLNGSTFSCESSRDPGSRVVRIAAAGELDLATAARLEFELDMAGAQPGDLLELDLRELSFMDCSGLSVVLRAARRAQQAGVELSILQGPAAVMRVFEITGLADELPFSAAPAQTPR